MSELNLSLSDRRSYGVPIAIAVGVLAVIFGVLSLVTPRHVAELSVTRVSVLPVHTVFPGDSIKVGAQDQAEDDFYVVAEVRIQDTMKLPIFINDLTGTLTTADGAQVTANAVEKRDLGTLYGTFPKLRELAGAPLLRESEIAPGATVEGAVLLRFPVTEAIWKARRSAAITVDTYHQGPLTVAVPN